MGNTQLSQLFSTPLRHGSGEDIEFGLDDRGEGLFRMEKDELRVKAPLRQGVFNVTLWARRSGSDTTATEHFIRVIVTTDREKYPVFQKLNYEMKVSYPTYASYS